MTTLTSLGLPYQQATDRPCDAPATWCNFVSVAETQLLAIDTILGRISPTVPAAKIRRSTPLTINPTGFNGIPFESSVFDTDNMVNLSNAPAILPHRLGRYVLTVTIQNITTSWSASTNAIGAIITSGSLVTDPATTTSTWSTVGNGSGIALTLGAGAVINDNWFHAFVMTDWTSGDSLGWGIAISPNVAGVLGLVEFSAHWITDIHTP